MTQHFSARTLLDRFVGVQQKPTILVSFLSDERLFTLPLQFSSLLHVIGKILVRLESLQPSAYLAGKTPARSSGSWAGTDGSNLSLSGTRMFSTIHPSAKRDGRGCRSAFPSQAMLSGSARCKALSRWSASTR